MRRASLGPFLLALVFALPAAAARPEQECAQQSDGLAADAAREEVREMLRQARQQIREFEEKGGQRSDPQHPAVQWSERLWKLGSKHQGSPAGAEATSEAFHLLIHADRIPQAYELADRLPPSDPAWESLLQFLSEAARLSKDYSYALRKLQFLMDQASDTDRRTVLRIHLASAYWQQDQPQQAIELFETVLRESPGGEHARAAEGALYELKALAPGQPAPLFSVTARGGSSIALAGFRGQAVVLIFWSTT